MIKQSSEAAMRSIVIARTYKRRKLIAQLQAEDRDDTEMIKGWMEEDGVDYFDIEGAPPCVLKSRSTGMKWDSHAIREMFEKRPFEAQKVIELGAVKLSVDVLKKAIANGQLAGLPVGGIEGTTEYLTFVEER